MSVQTITLTMTGISSLEHVMKLVDIASAIGLGMNSAVEISGVSSSLSISKPNSLVPWPELADDVGEDD